MNTFSDISDEHLLLALIRKLRVRKVVTGGRTAPEGTAFDSLYATAVGTTLFKQKEFDLLVRRLVQDGILTLAGRISFHDGEERKIGNTEHGRIVSLHPDAAVLEHQFFTENWTPIIARRSKDTGRRLYPNDDMSYHRLRIKMVHITADGLPRSLVDEPAIYPAR